MSSRNGSATHEIEIKDGKMVCTSSARAFKEDLLRGHHSEAAADVLVHGIAELGPGAALDGTLAEASFGELADARGCGNLNLVSVLTEFVLDHLLNPALVGADNLLRRQQEIQILAVFLVELSPSQLVRLLLPHHFEGHKKLGFSILGFRLR